MRQEDMINSIMRGARERDRQEALGSLSELLKVLEIVAQDLAKTITALRKQQIETGAKLPENAPNP